MKNEIIKILWKWSMDGKIDQHSYEDMATELAGMVAKNLHKTLVSGSVCDCEEHDQVPVTLRPALKCKLCGLPLAN